MPLNVAETVLMMRGRDNPVALGFSLHGAGRSVSRSDHHRRAEHLSPKALLAQETQGLDIRFLAGAIDPFELPSSYKRDDAVVRQITRFGLAEIEDEIGSVGYIMAGDAPAPWRGKSGGRREREHWNPRLRPTLSQAS